MDYDSLDPHQTLMGPIANVHAAVFSRVLRYTDERNGVIAPDLAESMPEQPDDRTYVIRLRDGVRFHDGAATRFVAPKLAGRALTAEDVRYSIARQIAQSSGPSRRYYRRADWSMIDRMDVVDARTLRITLKTPTAPFLDFLAGPHAFVLGRENVGTGDQIANPLALIGTGPFRLESFESRVAVKLRRNADWFATDDDAATGGGRPYLDGYDAYMSPQEDAFQRIAFERADIDATGFADGAVLDQERKTNLSDIALEESAAGLVLAARFLVDRPPFRDARARRAVYLALDRPALRALLYPDVDGRPSAQLSGPVPPALQRFAVPNAALQRRPAYRSDQAGRDADRTEARALWSAAFGGSSPGDVRALFPGLPRVVPERLVTAVQQQLRGTLGVAISPVVDTSGSAVIAAALGRNTDAATEGISPLTFVFEEGGPDIDAWLYGQFHSEGAMNSYRLQDAQLDSMLERSRAAFDARERAKLGIDIQDYLMTKVNARADLLAPIERRLSWGYVRNAHVPLAYGETQHLADTWLDSGHPAWRQRPQS